MPIFLTQQDVYRILQRENPPDDVYPDGAPTAFFSTADQFSVAGRIGNAYANLESIYANYSPVTADKNLSDFEFMHFGYTLDSSLPLGDRRTRVLAKIRQRRRTTPDDLLKTVYTIVDASILVEIAEWGCGDAGWRLDISELDISTILNEFNGLEMVGPNLCQLDAGDYGLSPEEFARLQAEAYTYEVRIYGYTLTDDERFRLEQVLNEDEPARSAHIILDGLDPSDSLGGST